MRNKLGVLREETGTKKSPFLTMVTTFGLVRNAYAQSLVQNEINMDALFRPLP